MISTDTIEDDRLKCIFIQSAANNTTAMRVEKKTAARWLLENKCLIRGGNVRYLQIKDLGLGVCEVMLRPIGEVNTFVVKSFEA